MSEALRHIADVEQHIVKLKYYSNSSDLYLGKANLSVQLALVAAQMEANEHAHTANLLQAESLAIHPLRTDPPLTEAERTIIERLGL